MNVFATPPGNEFGSSAAAEIAIEIGVPIFLIRCDLIRRPGFRYADQAVWNISLGEIIEEIWRRRAIFTVVTICSTGLMP
jgi:hypothetical protein